MLAKKKFLLFDHDGVLANTEHWYFKATQEAIMTIGVEMSFDDYKQHLVDGRSRDLARKTGSTEPQIATAKAHRDEICPRFPTTESIDIPGVEESLTEFGESFRMAIVTTAIAAGIQCMTVHNEFTAHQDLSAADLHVPPLDDLVGQLNAS